MRRNRSYTRQCHSSLLGIAWAVLLPLAQMLIFTFVFTKAVKVTSLAAFTGSSAQMPYALYAFAGLVPWTFFALSINGCVNSLVANRNLITKVYFPREVFPLACVGSSFVDFAIAMSVLVALMLYFHVTGQWVFELHATMLFLPVVVLVQIALTVGIGMMLGMANLFYRDVRQIVGMALQLGMFISAVVVPVPRDGSLLASVLAINPLVPIIGAYRSCILHGQLPEGGAFAYAVLVAVVMLVVGWWSFRRASFRFAECI